jgi:hypothetical protein
MDTKTAASRSTKCIQALIKKMFDTSIPEVESRCAALNLSYWLFVIGGRID